MENTTPQPYLLWINEAQRIISFHKEPGFEQKQFQSRSAFDTFLSVHIAREYRFL